MSETPPSPPERKPRRKSAPKPKKPAIGNLRRQARELALQTLYESDITSHGLDEIVARLRATLETEPETFDYMAGLIRSFQLHRDRIDAYIGAAAPAFPVDQLAAIDRNILRIAVLELLERTDVPPKAAINEAVELAKRFGGDASSRFVNGVLGTILARVEKERAASSNEAEPASSNG